MVQSWAIATVLPLDHRAGDRKIERVFVTVIVGESDFAALGSWRRDEKITLRHSGDFAGQAENYIFEWRTRPPVDGLPPVNPPEQWSGFTPKPATGEGALDITIEGSGLFTLTDNYFICRYRPKSSPVCTDAGNSQGWSDWTAPQLAEGWIKRVVRGINPFEQRIKAYQDNQVNTIVSMISQAGTRSVGSVPLSQQAANDFGLIEIYETVLKRGIGLSIEGAPSVDYGPANDALLLVAGRLADLYMLLGNEAYADAEKMLREYGEKIPAGVKSEIEAKITEVRQVIGGEDVAAMRTSTEALKTAISNAGAAMYQEPEAAAAGTSATSDGAASQKPDEGEVIDGEVREEK